VIHLLGAVDDPGAALSGVEGLALLEAGGVAYVGIPAAGVPAPDAGSLMTHDAVVSRLMDVCTVVPFRFGTVVRDVVDLEVKMATLGADMPHLLGWLRGRREVALRAALPQSTSGRRDASARPMPAELEELHSELSGNAVSAWCTWDDPQALMRGAYLVEAGDVNAFSEAAFRAAACRPAVTGVSLTGPWAPYSFTRLDLVMGVAGA
jgi:hypothetical protein